MVDLSELKCELTAPIKSFRLFAIEKALKLPISEELAECLHNCLATESDPECIMLLKHALKRVAAKKASHPTDLCLDEAYQSFLCADEETQLEIVSKLKLKDIKQNKIDSALLTDLLNGSRSSLVLASIVKKFSRAWPEEKKAFLEKNLFSSSKALQIACIEGLIKRFPESIKPFLLKIVPTNDPGIRFLAIFGLTRNFPELGAAFIRDCLANGDYFNKLRGLQACTTIDFSIIRNDILNFVAVETDARLLQNAFSIIFNNPDKEIPFRLIDFSIRASEQKKEFLKLFQEKYLENLEKIGICSDFASYREAILEYSQKQAARVCIFETFASVDCANPEEIDIAIQILVPKLSNQIFRQELEEYISVNCPGLKDAKNKIQRAISPDADRTTNPSESIVKTIKEELLIKEFAKARFSGTAETARLIEQILKNTESSLSLKASAIKAAFHMQINGYEQTACDLTTCQDDYHIAAGLEYLSKFDQEKFHHLTQKFFNTESFLIRTTLIRVTSRVTPDYAKFLIRHLLENRDRSKRQKGLESSIQIDFCHIAPLLSNFLKNEEDEELIDACLGVFMANPSLETLKILTDVRHYRPNFSEKFLHYEEQIAKQIQILGIASSEEITIYLQNCKNNQEKLQLQLNQEKDIASARKKINWNATNLITEKTIGGKFKILFLVFTSLLALILFKGASDSYDKKADAKFSKDNVNSAKRKTTAKLPTLPPKEEIIEIKLVDFDLATEVWNCQKTTGGRMMLIIKYPEQYNTGETIKIVVKEASYSLTGVEVILGELASEITSPSN